MSKVSKLEKSRAKWSFFCAHVSRLESLVFLWRRHVYGGSCNTSPFRRFPSRFSCRFAWQAWHCVTSQPVLYRVESSFVWLAKTMHSTLYTTLYTPHSTLHTLHSTLHHTLHSTLYTLHTPHSSLYTLHSTLHTLYTSIYTFHYTLHTLHFTLHTPQFTL